MTILYNNIGKDLSRVSMPAALNEPLSLLQRLSEELEYSELLDIANHIDDPFERMVSFWVLIPLVVKDLVQTSKYTHLLKRQFHRASMSSSAFVFELWFNDDVHLGPSAEMKTG